MQTVRDDFSDVADVLTLVPRREESSELPSVVVRGLVGLFCGSVDIFVLSAILVWSALTASNILPQDKLIDLLAVRMSVQHFVLLVMCWVIWRAIFWYCDLYTWRHVRSVKGIAGRLAFATALCAVLAGCVVAVSWGHGHFWRNSMLFWGAAFCGLAVVRGLVAAFCLHVRPHLRKQRNVIIVGAGPHAQRIHRELLDHPEWNYKLLGLVGRHHLSGVDSPDQVLGRISDLEEILMRRPVEEVVIALPMKSQYDTIERVVAICERVGVQVQYSADLFETSVAKRSYSEEHGASRRIVLKMVHDDHRHHLKRALDIAGAALGIILLAPLFAIVAILIKCTSRGPVFFRQERYGLNRRIFSIYKFRSMVIDAEAAQAQLEHMNQNSGPVFKIFADPRVTTVGAILRRTSIDELPQLFNVLKGEMSLVGPRPLNLRDVGRFSEGRLMRRFSVKPGLTCLWQVSGRSNISFDRWIAMDLHYIDNWSLLLDMKILAKTVPAVVKCRGAA
jgi:exopolysaccharide biosynthesis polyprenyl glycosylphosphotransferase